MTRPSSCSNIHCPSAVPSSRIPLTTRRRARVAASRGLVDRVAARVARLFRGLVCRDELVSIGHEALVRAVHRYQADREVPFEGYAEPRVFGAMMNFVAEEAAEKYERRVLAQVAREHRSRNRRSSSPPPSVSDDEAHARAARRVGALANAAVASAAARPDDDRARELILLQSALASLGDDERRLLAAIYTEGASAVEIASRLGCSVPTLRRRRDRILRRVGAQVRPSSG